jgi:predicted ATP-dependent protease
LGPISLIASLTFEQSYSEIEGDSASAAELIALVSAIADAPLRQDLAITGSVNQHGQIQPIGGVNEKIEGYFAVCSAKGLSGSQGVLIPRANQRNLMLKSDVIEAVKAGKFHIWPISTVEEGLDLMTGLDVGDIQSDGSYPENTLYHLVMAQLAEFAKSAEHAVDTITGEANSPDF